MSAAAPVEMPDAGFWDLALIALVSGLTAAVLAALARRVGWVDAARAVRKLQQEPVPAVGGAAILAGLLAAELVCAPLRSRAALGTWFADADVTLLALALAGAFGVGLVDDLCVRGLSPLSKLAGQSLVGVLLATSLLAGGASPAKALLAIFLAVVAQNAVNTFDNADGAATALALVGLAPGAAPWAAASAGFLPFNLWLRSQPGAGPEGTPRAYLGDAGSHLLGLLLLVSPGGFTVLALPVFDLIRLSIVRTARGSRPWIGDRRHLAHRLIDGGCSRTAVVLVLAAIAAPPVLARWSSPADGSGATYLAIGWFASAALFALALRASPATE